MQFLRKITHSKDIEGFIRLPNELRNRKLEILIFPIEDDKEQSNREKNFNPQEFQELFTIEDIEKEISKIRDEWERI